MSVGSARAMALIRDTWLNWYKDRRVQDGVVSFVTMLQSEEVRRILDFGCGTGRHTVYIAKLGFDVYGYDWSEPAIEIAQRELTRERLPAKLQVWDMTVLPLPYVDDFFDAVVVVRVLHHTYIETIKRIVSEIARITRGGGYLYLEAPSYEYAVTQPETGSPEPEPGTWVPLKGPEVGIPHHHFKRNELLETFKAFKTVEVEERNGHHCFTGIKN